MKGRAYGSERYDISGVIPDLEWIEDTYKGFMFKMPGHGWETVA